MLVSTNQSNEIFPTMQARLRSTPRLGSQVNGAGRADFVLTRWA